MLSLQTLLSFSDQLNDAEHQEMIAKRIAVDKYASQLLLRLDYVKKSSKLEAPDVFDPDVVPNANFVAEYLDHQLQNPEQIHEYENACLESDSILAELGCCYDILNHRLPIPINPPKNCRHRLYYIPIQDAATKSDSSKNSVKEEKNQKSVSNDSLSNVSKIQKETDLENEKDDFRSISDSSNQLDVNLNYLEPLSENKEPDLINSSREFDLKPKFSVGRFLFKQVLAASLVLASVYFWSNGSSFNLEQFWQEQNQLSNEDELESEIIGTAETKIIRPSIISTSNIKNMSVITVDELKKMQKNPQSVSNKDQKSVDSSNDDAIIFDDSDYPDNK